jgi:putative transposase
LSFRRIEPFVEVCHVAVHDWYHRLEHLFEPDRDRRQAVAVDETKLDIEDEEVYVWAAVDVDTFEVLHVDVSPGRSGLDALLFLQRGIDVLPRSANQLADRGDWYDWPLDLLECEPKRETWGDRSLIEAWFGLLKYRTMLFWHRFPHSTGQPNSIYTHDFSKNLQ